MSVVFDQFAVPGAQVVHGNEFPYGLQAKVSDGASAPLDLERSIAALVSLSKSGELWKLLEKHGAILIRRIGQPSAESFAKLINAVELGRNSKPHVQIGEAGKRTLLAENVFTANEGPQERRFYQHNEYSRYTRFPANIHFYCEKKAPEGGETPIAHSALVYEKLNEAVPELVENVRRHGLAMKMLFRAPGNEGKSNQFNWAGPYNFGQDFKPNDDWATKKKKAEKQVQKLTHDFHWTEDDSIELTQYIPGLRRAPGSGRPLWFNGLVGRFAITRDVGALEPPHIGHDGMSYLPCDYGDGTIIPREYLEKMEEIVSGLEVDLLLGEGEILLVDNFQVSHGRKPWKGDRRILVSLWEGATPIKDFEVF